MPGFVIHIAIAKEYERKHKNEIKNTEEFIKGAIAPDYISITNPNENKNKTHYGIWGDWTSNNQEIHLNEFLEDKKVNLNTDYWKGYFIHLLSDHYFSEKYFKQEIYNAKKNKEKLYNDYDCLNKELLKKYNIEVLEETKKYMNCFDEKPKYLEINKVEKFIEDMSNINLKEQEQLIRQKGMEGIK